MGNTALPRAMRIYESVQHLFDYPSLTSTRWSAQISWRTVYNLYIRYRGIGRGHGRGREGRAEIDEDDDWMDAIGEE